MYFVNVYILKKKLKKKKFQDFQIFPKKEKIFQMKKSLWTRGIKPLSLFFERKKKKKKENL